MANKFDLIWLIWYTCSPQESAENIWINASSRFSSHNFWIPCANPANLKACIHHGTAHKSWKFAGIAQAIRPGRSFIFLNFIAFTVFLWSHTPPLHWWHEIWRGWVDLPMVTVDTFTSNCTVRGATCRLLEVINFQIDPLSNLNTGVCTVGIRPFTITVIITSVQSNFANGRLDILSPLAAANTLVRRVLWVGKFARGRYGTYDSLKSATFGWRDGSPSNTWFLGHTWVNPQTAWRSVQPFDNEGYIYCVFSKHRVSIWST